MSIFSFLAHAGEKISDFITGDGKAEDAIKARIEQLGLKIQNLQVDVDGDTATLTGTAPSQDALEKAILAAGNIKDIANVDSQLQLAQSTATADDSQTSDQSRQGTVAGQTSGQAAGAENMEQPNFYQVKSGDTLSKISKQFYGDANRYNEIFEANKPMLTHPDKIYPGQTLRIPNAEGQRKAA